MGPGLQVTGKCDGPAALGLDAAPDAVGSPEHVSHATALRQPKKGGHVPLPDQWDRGSIENIGTGITSREFLVDYARATMAPI